MRRSTLRIRARRKARPLLWGMRLDPHQLLYHGTQQPVSRLDERFTTDGAIHLGSRSQAVMRAHPARGHLLVVRAEVGRLRRARDTGEPWNDRIASAKRAGANGLFYLNRYEGIRPDTVLRAQQAKVNLDRLSDEGFRLFAPEAELSYIIFHADQLRLVGIESLPLACRPGAPSSSFEEKLSA